MVWNTESGDSGLAGFWRKMPSKLWVGKYIAKQWPDDYEAETFNYYFVELSEMK